VRHARRLPPTSGAASPPIDALLARQHLDALVDVAGEATADLAGDVANKAASANLLLR
jgi:hypothetical protein